jgi:hypothetical protein
MALPSAAGAACRPGLHRLGPIRAQVLAPVHRVLVADEAERGARLRLALVEAIAVLIHHGRRIGRGEHALGHQLVRRTSAAPSASCGSPDTSAAGSRPARRPRCDRAGGSTPGSITTSLWNFMRYSSAKRVTKHTASGSSALTCKIGASTIFATSEQYSVERASLRIAGGEAHLIVDDDVHRSRRCRKPRACDSCRVSMMTPWPANAASP